MRPTKRIALFTNFHPDIGGGSVNLRSIIAAWGDKIELTWYYLGKSQCRWPGAVCLGHNIMGGGFVKDFLQTPLLLRGIRPSPVRPIVNRLLADKPDGYWLVAMNEGLAVGNCLLKMGLGPKLHVSVQDDQFGWMWSRSRRYKWVAPWFKKPWRKLLLGAKSVDVTSDGMQKHYQKEMGLVSTVVHPYVAELPKMEPVLGDEDRLIVGHIGSVYDLKDFRIFLRAARQWAAAKNKKFKLLLVGFSGRHMQALADIPPDEIENHPNLPEAEAVKRLQSCHFVYAMYPFKPASALFRQTSLPTKLSTYIQVQRPIFAHTPLDSSLAALVRDYGLGLVAPSLNPDKLSQDVGRIAEQVPQNDYETAREKIYGWHNVDSLRHSLLEL